MYRTRVLRSVGRGLSVGLMFAVATGAYAADVDAPAEDKNGARYDGEASACRR